MEDKDNNRLKNFNFLNKYYSKQDKKTKLLVILSLIGILLFLLSSATFPFKDKLFSLLYPKPSSKASETKEEIKETGPSFISNELLVKVKREARGKVKENPGATGVASIDKLNIGKDPKAKFDFKVKSFERVAKAGKNSKTDHDLFSWYLLTLDAPSLKASGRLDQVSQMITANQGSKNNPADIHSQAVENLQQIIQKLKQDPDIEAIDLNYIVNTQVVPNDPYYSSTGSWGQAYPDLWGMKKINMESTWDQATGSASIVVAGIDTGVDRNHPDIAANMWTNSAETPSNGIDDDANGYIDDYYGWNYVKNSNDPMDDHGHGTHTVGTIAGVGNNGLGVVGVNWTSKIMALKFLDSGGSGYLDNGIKALQYAADMGARVSSNSWGCGCNSTAMDDAVKYEHDKGMVMVAAAGNSNADAIDFSPASADFAIAVAASDPNDLKASFSNWGERIDVAAPGVDILSTRASNNPMCTAARTVGTNYCRVSGTSMATPHVAGLVALLLSKNPALTNEEVRQIIRNGADDLGTPGKDTSYGYGRINATGSINLATTHPLTPYISSPRSRTIVVGSSPVVQITGSVGGPNFASYKVEAGAGRTPSSWTLVTTSAVQPTTNSTLASLDTSKFTEGKYTIRLTTTDTAGKAYQFQVNDITIDNFDAMIDFPRSLVSFGSTDIVGTAITKNGMPFANYTVEWSPDGSNWSTSGIALTNGGLQPVSGGKLGNWNTSGFTDGKTYTLRLTVNSSLGGSQQITANPKGDKDLVLGWPKYLSTAYVTEIIPTMVDLDDDGNKELIYALPDGKVYAYKKDGNSLPGFPITVAILATGTNLGTLNVDDLDGDGKKEIVITNIITNANYESFSNINIIKSDGTFYPGWPRLVSGRGGNMSPTIADLDGDGTRDMIFMQVETSIDKTDLNLHAYHLNGTELSGFPKHYTLPPVGFDAGNIFPSKSGGLSVFDLDNDGKPELSWVFSNRIYLFDNAGNILPGWPYIVPLYNSSFDGTNRNYIMVFEDFLAAGDVYGNDQQEVFALSTIACFAVSGGGFSGFCYAVGPTVMYGFTKDGTVLSGWPKTDATDNFKSGYGSSTYGPVFTDIDADGKDEIIVNSDPNVIFDVEGKKTLASPPTMYTQPVLSDVDGDGQLEIAGGLHNTITIVKQNSTNFSTYWQRIINGNYFISSPVIADMDNNGQMEMAAIDKPVGWNSNGLSGSINSIYLWNIPKSGVVQYEWPMFGHDPARTGRLVLGPVSTPTPTPSPTLTPTPSPSLSPSPSPSPTPPAQQYGIITGTVSSSTGGVLGGVKISTKVGGVNKTYYTNSFGVYSITNLPPGTYSLTFSSKGYVNQKISVIVTSNTTTTRNITLVKR